MFIVRAKIVSFSRILLYLFSRWSIKWFKYCFSWNYRFVNVNSFVNNYSKICCAMIMKGWNVCVCWEEEQGLSWGQNFCGMRRIPNRFKIPFYTMQNIFLPTDWQILKIWGNGISNSLYYVWKMTSLVLCKSSNSN